MGCGSTMDARGPLDVASADEGESRVVNHREIIFRENRVKKRL